MKILILSCNTGEGHNSCANAIREACAGHGDECAVEDALRFVSPGFSRFISNWHVRIYRYMPKLFRGGYSYMEDHPKRFRSGSCVYELLGKGADQLCEFIREGAYDTVVCTHPFASLMLTDMLQKYPMSIRTAFAATDYTCSPSTQECCPDFCFVPHEDVAEEFTCKNIPRENIIPSGIPVRAMFYQSTDKDTAKMLQGIPEEHSHLLVMCGSMGCGPIKKIVKELSKILENNRRVTVVCGTNEKLRCSLEELCRGDERFIIRGYVQNMSLLMDSADLYLTKPGGISTTEAAQKCLPMVFVNAVAGCEEHNCRFYVRHGGAVTGDKPEELSALCARLLDDEELRHTMELALKRLRKENAAECILCRLENCGQGKEAGHEKAGA